MNIDHVHFYVDNAAIWRDWFVQILGFQALPPGPEAAHTHTEVVRRGAVCFWLSSARQSDSPVAAYLQRHPPGVVDVAFRVRDLGGESAHSKNRPGRSSYPGHADRGTSGLSGLG
jgi:4-hydroxyphenylpyruvate dioxygenase